MREFETGATRDSDENKLDFDGFVSIPALTRFAEYMHKHRKQADGRLRDSDNWQKGMPPECYRKSAWRHFLEFARAAREGRQAEAEEAACALWFNIQGWLHETLKVRQANPRPGDIVDLKCICNCHVGSIRG